VGDTFWEADSSLLSSPVMASSSSARVVRASQPTSSSSAPAPATSAPEKVDTLSSVCVFFVVTTDIGQPARVVSLLGRTALRHHLESFLEEKEETLVRKTDVKALSLEQLAKRVFEVSEEDYDHDESCISAIIAGGQQFPQN
jgi:hypothetical protein